VLLAQTEVGEVAEGRAEGKGVSSAMPHKRNPVDATMAMASARLAIGQVSVILSAMSQEHERAAGAWQAEWIAMPSLFRYAAGAVARVRSAVEGLEVDADRMLANLAAGGSAVMSESLTMALAAKLGRPAAQALVSDIMTGRAPSDSLRARAFGDARVRAVLSADDIQRALEPSSYLGVTDALIDRTLASWQELRALPVAP
jgi:3-carboxy-cis,cis-muconate cycloisomerase